MFKDEENAIDRRYRAFRDERDATPNKLNGYAILWNNKTPFGQYFSLNTNFGDITKVNNLIRLNGDGFDSIGTVKAIKDDSGIFIEATLHMNTPFELQRLRSINILLAKGLLIFIANPDMNKLNSHLGGYVSDKGEVTYWPLIDISLVPVPDVRNSSK